MSPTEIMLALLLFPLVVILYLLYLVFSKDENKLNKYVFFKRTSSFEIAIKETKSQIEHDNESREEELKKHNSKKIKQKSIHYEA